MQSCRLRRLHSQSAPLSPRAWAQQCRPYRQSRRPSSECSLPSLLRGGTLVEGSSLANLYRRPAIQLWQRRCSKVQIAQTMLPGEPHRKRRPQPIFLYSSLATNY